MDSVTFAVGCQKEIHLLHLTPQDTVIIVIAEQRYAATVFEHLTKAPAVSNILNNFKHLRS